MTSANPEVHQVVRSIEAVPSVKGFTSFTRPENYGVGVVRFAPGEDFGQQQRPDSLAAMFCADVEVCQVDVALGFRRGVRDLLDELSPDVSARRFVALRDPTLPTRVVAKPLTHPHGAALDELRLPLDLT